MKTSVQTGVDDSSLPLKDSMNCKDVMSLGVVPLDGAAKAVLVEIAEVVLGIRIVKFGCPRVPGGNDCTRRHFRAAKSRWVNPLKHRHISWLAGSKFQKNWDGGQPNHL
jgi:hypothetical protein